MATPADRSPLGSRSTRVLLCVALILTVAPSSSVEATTFFAIDPASPSIGSGISGSVTPDDVLIPSPEVFIEGIGLGLQHDVVGGLFDNLNALSWGLDPLRTPEGDFDPSLLEPILFSVDRVAVGLPGTAVFNEALPGNEEAAGDVFSANPLSNPGFNQQFIDETTLGLIEGFFGDDLDGLEVHGPPAPTYFSIDAQSITNITLGGGTTANDIFRGSFSLAPWASGEVDIGLDFDDDLDALVLDDISVGPGVLDPGEDIGLFSLSPFSPTVLGGGVNCANQAITVSPADVLITFFDGCFDVFATATSMGLRVDDNIDALDTVVPEPSTLSLVALGVAWFAVARRRGQHGRMPPGTSGESHDA